MATLIYNIKSLVNVREATSLLRGTDLSCLPCIDDAWLLTEGTQIAAYGEMKTLPHPVSHFKDSFNAEGRYVLPCWCDSHTHLVYPASREEEFVDKIKGLSYAEIAARGGGILSSAGRLAEASEDELFNSAYSRLKEITAAGTGAVEIKSGYGLSTAAELKMLRVIQRLKQAASIPIKATFLGAHAIPQIYKENKQAYIQLIIDEMLPVIAGEKLADYMDVFCENGFFSAEEAGQLLGAGKRYGLVPKLHTNQLASIGGIAAGIRTNALSLDHLETVTAADLQLLKDAYNTGHWKGVCTLLPSAAFFLRMPFQPARDLIDAGCAIALATDYNPGSSPSGNMNFVVSLSCIQMRMLPEEAINAATINGAFAMGLGETAGSITRGKLANLMITDAIPSLAYLPYSFGNNRLHKIMIGGEWQ